MPGLIYIPAFGMVFYLEKKQRHIFWFLSFSSRADIKLRKGGEDCPDASASHVVSIKLAYQKSLLLGDVVLIIPFPTPTCLALVFSQA